MAAWLHGQLGESPGDRRRAEADAGGGELRRGCLGKAEDVEDVKVECANCGETCRKREAKEAVNVGMVCPDCADAMTECEECELLFEPEGEAEVCPDCRGDEDEEEGGEEEDRTCCPKPASTPSGRGRGRVRGRAVRAERVLRGCSVKPKKVERQSVPPCGLPQRRTTLPRLRAEVAAELAAMDDGELRAAALAYWGGDLERLVLSAEKRQRVRPPRDELERRLDVFAAELRRGPGGLGGCHLENSRTPGAQEGRNGRPGGQTKRRYDR